MKLLPHSYLRLYCVRLLALVPLPVILAIALIARVDTWRRLQARARPRLVWGPTPVISIKYWSQAVKSRGYESTTVVDAVSHINSKDDFDLILDDFLPFVRGDRFARLRKRYLFVCWERYLLFCWALTKFDIFNFYFDGGFLRSTPLAFMECQILKLAKKKIVLSPYGSDIAVPENLGVYRDSVLTFYPQFKELAPQIRRRVLYFTRYADFIIRNMQAGFLPRYDLTWPTCIAIDTDRWKSDHPTSAADGHQAEVVVTHSSNHRPIKATDALIQTVEELRGEGLKIRLELFEKRSNEEVRAGILDCDIVAEQFIGGGYALAAIEGMSASKPVLSNLSVDGEVFTNSTCSRYCPIVDTPQDKIRENLLRLVENPQLRRNLGEAGRAYVLRYHSQQAIGKVWDDIYRHVWLNEPAPSYLSGTQTDQSGV